MSETVLSIQDVTKEFYLPHHSSDSLKESITQIFKKKEKGGDKYQALKGISFDVKKGDFYGIVGRNGAGKSTLLRILAEIYQPTSGRVWHHGKLVPFIELGVGFNNNLSGKQNVYLNGAMLGFSKKEMDERYQSIVDFAELEKFMDQKLKNYSSGMRVRLAFSVAIQADADILLLDEVLAVGDADFKKKCFAYFDTLKEKKKTIIFVSHGMNAIRQYCNKAILIENGKISYQGSADEVADKYMQLFADKGDKQSAKQPDAKDRWGSNKVKIDKIDFTRSDDKLNLKVTLLSGDKDVQAAKVDVLIKDKKGVLVAGFDNLNITGAKKLSFKKNEMKVLDFEIDNIFSAREYTISAVVAADEDVEVFDGWNNIASFSNVEPEDVLYPVVAPGKMTTKSRS